jgi:hypothetical protein
MYDWIGGEGNNGIETMDEIAYDEKRATGNDEKDKNE